jgi:hypothetical protein
VQYISQNAAQQINFGAELSKPNFGEIRQETQEM